TSSTTTGLRVRHTSGNLANARNSPCYPSCRASGSTSRS
ncbi:uncharacterized protein METZ01_LOCUS500003, partial [marine metagenome]